jgi:hypothetical protein
MVWIAVAFAIWMVGAIMAFWPSTRRTAWSLALAMLMPCSGVMMSQRVGRPIVFVLGAAVALLSRLVEPGFSGAIANSYVA